MKFDAITSGKIKLLGSEALVKQERDAEYLQELDVKNLLFPFRYESGLEGSVKLIGEEFHSGWDSPLSHIRGTFTGHYLSACALLCRDGEYGLLRAKAEYIVEEIRKNQIHNGGRWAFPIPEKYLYTVRDGKHFWAPFYVCHKVMMGLFDMWQLLHNETAHIILDACTDWFVDFLKKTSDETLENMMNIEETGGIMELWAQLYGVTKDERHLYLLRRMERKELFEAMLAKKDVLTNMHANTTIPEIHGACAAYEATGEKRYLEIAENYWELAVTERGMFATGGQTSGEVWTPKMRQSARLGDQNQEHCVVYNMIRLADYLLRFTGKAEYGDYIERNIINGLFAQGFYRSRTLDSYGESLIPQTGIVAYYLPLMAGGEKRWSSKTKDFWCCHCTVVQANARYWEYIYYQKEAEICISQYLPSEWETKVGEVPFAIKMVKEDDGVGCIEINEEAILTPERPHFDSYLFRITAEKETKARLAFRIPWWLAGPIQYTVEADGITVIEKDGYLYMDGEWKENQVRIILPRNLHCWPLADEPDTVAIMDGPDVLAGLVAEERLLYGEKETPESFIKPHNERLWGGWTRNWKTSGQPVGFYLKPIREIGTERYTVYFPIQKRQEKKND